MKKSHPVLKSHSPTPATLGERTFPTFPYRNLAFNYTRNKYWARIEPFSDGKVTFPAKPTFSPSKLLACPAGSTRLRRETQNLSWLGLGGWHREKFSLYIQGLIRVFSWYRFNKQNNNSACALHVFINLFTVSTLWENIGTRRQISFSLFALWCQCSLKIHFHRKIAYIWPP